jgi:hypothetical protein
MAAPPNVFWDPAGHFHTDALHWEGFPRLLWESLRSFFYTEPPCGRTNLNYTGSSTEVHSRGLQRASNGIIPWPVG